MSKILPKMSIKTLGANPKSAAVGANEAAKKVPMVRIMGIARGIKTAIGNNGDTVFGLTGQFEGVNIATGEVAQSGVLYLPSGIQELIQEPLEGIIAEDKNAAVTFAFDIFAVSATNPAGYSFEAELHGQPDREDPFAALRQTLSDAPLPKLPAPKAPK